MSAPSAKPSKDPGGKGSIQRTTISHRYNGTAPGAHPHHDGKHVADVVLELEDLGEKHPSGMAFELRIVHPKESFLGHKQSPEVLRFRTREEAEQAAEAYEATLSNT